MSNLCRVFLLCAATAALLSAAGSDATLTPDLFRAIRDNDAAAADKLLARGAPGNASDSEGATPLMQATAFADPALVKFLLDKGANPNARDKAGATALLWSVHDLSKVRLLVQKGANVNARSNAGKLPLLLAASYSHNTEAVKFLLDSGADLHGLDARGAGALFFATQGGDLDTMRLLLDKGLDVNAGTTSGFTEIHFSFFAPPTGDATQKGYTPLIVAAFNNDLAAAKLLLDRGASVNALLAAGSRGSEALVRLLVEKGADVKVKDSDDRTPLMLQAAGDYTNPEAIHLLLQKGADANAKGKDGRTALAWALQRGETPVARLLRDPGVPAPPTAGAVSLLSDLHDRLLGMVFSAVTPASADQNTLRAAVRKALPTLQSSGPPVVKQRGCITCHNQSIPAMAVSVARQQGFPVNEQIAAQELKATAAILSSHREDLLQHIASIPTAPEVVGYALVGMAAEKYPADRFTDALVFDLAAKQRTDGRWLNGDGRPPLEESDFTTTAMTLRALQLYPLPGRRDEFERRIAAARAWLQSAKAVSNEDRTFRLFGLAWSRGDTQDAVRDLVAHQRTNGGWAGLETLGPDAYATGQALAALRESGMSVSNSAYQRGVKYLLNAQLPDGSWHVRTRAIGFQPYFESGFPHGHDQWISSAGTAWSVLALAAAAEPEKRASR